MYGVSRPSTSARRWLGVDAGVSRSFWSPAASKHHELASWFYSGALDFTLQKQVTRSPIVLQKIVWKSGVSDKPSVQVGVGRCKWKMQHELLIFPPTLSSVAFQHPKEKVFHALEPASLEPFEEPARLAGPRRVVVRRVQDTCSNQVDTCRTPFLVTRRPRFRSPVSGRDRGAATGRGGTKSRT